jgi:hypothetical protein
LSQLTELTKRVCAPTSEDPRPLPFKTARVQWGYFSAIISGCANLWRTLYSETSSCVPMLETASPARGQRNYKENIATAARRKYGPSASCQLCDITDTIQESVRTVCIPSMRNYEHLRMLRTTSQHITTSSFLEKKCPSLPPIDRRGRHNSRQI